jgi:hypothetical protein
MNKKTNTVLFVLGATVVNIIMMIVLFLVLFVLFDRFLAPNIGEGIVPVFMLLIFIISVGGTYFIYHKLIKLVQARVDMEKYFDPIFNKKKK